MQRFCKKCGQKLDDKTGLCPICDKELSPQEIKAAVKKRGKALEQSKKAEKAARLKNMPFGKKLKRVLIRLLIAAVCVFAVGAAVGFLLSYNEVVHISAFDIVTRQIVDNSEPINATQAIGGSYVPKDENIVYENEDKTLGYVNNMILVYFRKTAEEAEINAVVSAIGGTVVGKIEELNQYQIEVEAKDKDALEAICCELMAGNDIVKNAAIDKVVSMEVDEVPNDPWKDTFQGATGVDWDEANPSGTNWWFEAAKVLSAWDNSSAFSNIRVGIVDNGFDVSHEDLNINVLNAEVNSSENHGTHVAGVIGAAVNNGRGISGILQNVSLYGVDCYQTGKQKRKNIAVSSLEAGIVSCVENECKVINMSSGVKFKNADSAREGSDSTARYTVEVLAAILDNYDTDFLVVQSAGNGNSLGKGVEAKTYNGWFSGIDEQLVGEVFAQMQERGEKFDKKITVNDIMNSFMVVAAVDDTKKNGYYQLADFSNYGSSVNVCAPGVNVFSTIKTGGLDGSYGYMDGTSMAAPIVSGVAALTWSVNQNMSSGDVKRIIIDTATQPVLSRRKADKGTYYMLDAEAAVKSAINKTQNNSGRIETSDERDIVLVLDVSGSMSGTPMEETKKASSNFISTILKEDASIGVVTYDDKASKIADFSMDESFLKSKTNSIDDGGGTDIEAGLEKARGMLASSNAKKKIIVLMSDGAPNSGKVGEELIGYAERIKNEGVYIYTLGFFENMGGSKSEAQHLMEQIASDGCHYEVANADDLKFFFGDVADQINGQKYIYVRIACPVDVKISYNGETLRSDTSEKSARTNFGTLTFEENKTGSSSGTDNRVKILRLKDGADYDVEIAGNGSGVMNYTIGFMDESGQYSDLRRFNNIAISPNTLIDTVAANGSATTLKVDSDGDGKYDIRYKAKANGVGEEIDYGYILYIIYAVGGIIVLLVAYFYVKKLKKNLMLKNKQKLAAKRRYCVYCGGVISGDKNFCPKCGKKI